MKIVSIADVKKYLSAYLRDTSSGPFIITRNGRPAGVLLPMEDEEEIERLVLAYSPRLQALLNASREGIEETGGVDHEAFWEDVASVGE
ncbi:MAG TPA: type II toxin-antitoxin system Phd/YefM family antitoxin [Anaerolineae bacterium]|nr:type II toxin-antitoxin system Phd/YefM family antitoxin [Anaerolineae bacterium]